MITNVGNLAPAPVVGEILVAAIHSIAEQDIPGHDREAVRDRFEGNVPAIARAAKTYAESIGGGKTEQGAKRDAALAVVKHYRWEYKL